MAITSQAKVLNSFIPQLFSSFGILAKGKIDEYKMTRMPSGVLLTITTLDLIAEKRKRDDIKFIVDRTLRGMKGVDGFASNQAIEATSYLGSGGRPKRMKKTGILGRLRGKPKYEEMEEE